MDQTDHHVAMRGEVGIVGGGGVGVPDVCSWAGKVISHVISFLNAKAGGGTSRP
jgi:hypothetical protein